MALIICPECGKEVSDRAQICIHCGYPLTAQDREGNNSKKELKVQQPDYLTPQEKEDGNFCIVNGKKYCIKEIIDQLKTLNNKDYEKLTETALYGKNPDANIRSQYLEDVEKTEEGKKIDDIRFELAKTIMHTVDLVYLCANEFLYEILINNNRAPEEFIGKSASEDRRERDAKMEEKKKYQPKCPTCGSTDIVRIGGYSQKRTVIRFGFASATIEKTFRCNNCNYMW